MSDKNDLPTLRYELGSMVVPGDRLGTLRTVASGMGTYPKNGHVYASVLGQLSLQPVASGYTVTVVPQGKLAAKQVLSRGQLVLVRITRITAPQAYGEIVAAEGIGKLVHSREGSIPYDETVGGRANREIKDCFQPGDWVVARILSLGDSRRYFLSTAEDSLGVLHAVSASSGKPMVPLSWNEMTCPESNTKELRKCAKPKESGVF